MYQPFWWAVWIGPQQIHQPNSELGLKCSLSWPLHDHCPVAGCVHMENITLRDIQIDEPLISPAVILGNKTNPIKNLTIENLQIKEAVSFGRWPFHQIWKGRWPFHREEYPWQAQMKCAHAEGTYINSNPEPACLAPRF